MVQRIEQSSKQVLLLSAAELAILLSCSVRHIRRLDEAGLLPKPVRLGKSVRWIATELHAWLAAGAPSRKAWESMKGGERQ